MRTAFIALFIVAAAIWAAGSPQAALAQYLEGVGGIEATTSQTTASAGDTATISCRVRDVDGAPEAGASVSFTMTANPGDAVLSSGSAMTGTDGTASVEVDVGSSSGVVQVSCSSGDLTSLVLVEVLGTSALPPASDIEPPNTGDGGLVGRSGYRGRVGLVLVASAVMVAAASLLAARRDIS